MSLLAAFGCGNDADTGNSGRVDMLVEEDAKLLEAFCERVRDCYPDYLHPANGCGLRATMFVGVEWELSTSDERAEAARRYRSCETNLSEDEWSEYFAYFECSIRATQEAMDCLASCESDDELSVGDCAYEKSFGRCVFPEPVESKLEPCD